MDILEPKAIVGTNSWGSAAYGKVLRGESVDRIGVKILGADMFRFAVKKKRG